MQQGGYKKLPQVQGFLMDVSIYDHLDEMAQKYNIPQDRLEELLDLTDAIMNGSAQIAQVPAMLGVAFGLDEQVSKQVACDLVGYRLLPLSDFIPEVEGSIKAWGGDVSVYPDLRIKKPQVDDELAGFAKDIGLELPDHLMKRFVFLSRGYINKERDHDATLTLLKRPITIGGLEMTEAQAQKLFEMLDAKFVIAPSKDDENGSPIVVGDSKEDAVSLPSSSASLPSSGLTRGSSDDENGSPIVVGDSKEEVVSLPSSSIPSLPSSSASLPSSGLTRGSSDDENGSLIVVGDVKKLEKTTLNREIMPIKAVPMALTTSVPVVSGSIMHEHEEREVAEHKKKLEKIPKIDDLYIANQEEIIESTAKEIFGFFKDAKQTQQSARELSRSFVKGMVDAQRAHAILVDKYLMSPNDALLVLKALQEGYDKLNKKPVVVQKTVQKDGIALQESSLLDRRHAALTKTVPKESVQSVMPKARVSASRTKQEELAGSGSKINTNDLKQAQEKSRPEKAKVMLSSQSVAPKNKQDIASKVVDISYSQKLVGPIEELGTMSIIEFRRLSSDPMEASRKIFSVLDLLEEDDYEQRVKGILAFRQSPLQKLYLSITQEALQNGAPVSDIVAQRRNKGELSLSASEIEAIVEINNRIRF